MWQRSLLEALQPEGPNADTAAVWPEAPGESVDFVLVGEAPGIQEVKQGKPFVGRSGVLLREMAADHRLLRVHYTNASFYRPPVAEDGRDTRPTTHQITRERRRLLMEIAMLRPRSVVALGATAAHALCGNVPRMRGMVRYVHYLGVEVPVYITHHPARILYEPDVYKDVCEDMERIVEGRLPEPFLGDLELEGEINEFQGEAIYVDTESTSTHFPTADLRCVSVYTNGRSGIYTRDTLGSLRAGLERYAGRVVGHNTAGDELLLRRYGVPISFTDDTLLRHYSQDERRGSHGLKVLAPVVGGCDTGVERIWPYTHGEGTDETDFRGGSWEAIPDPTLQQYCARDAYCTARVEANLVRSSTERDERLYAYLRRAQRAFTDGMERGIAIDRDCLRAELADQEEKVEALKATFDFNPESHAETLAAVRAAGHGVSSVSRSVLSGLPGDLPARVLAYRKEAKILKAFLRPLEGWLTPDGVLHPTYKLFGTDSGRTSSADPNIQQIPPHLKHLFIARPGRVLLGWDYKTHEVRGLQYYIHDRTLGRLLADSDADPHAFVGARADLARQEAKRALFAVAYGASEGKLVEVGISREKARKAIAAIRQLFPTLETWRRAVIQQMNDVGHVETPYGRRRNFWYIDERTQYKAERIAVNFLVQSLCSDITMDATIQVYEKLHLPPLIYVHDFNCVEVGEEEVDRLSRASEEIARSIFPNEHVAWVPEMKFGRSWGDMRPTEEDTERSEEDE